MRATRERDGCSELGIGAETLDLSGWVQITKTKQFGLLPKSPSRSMSAEDKSAGDDAGDRQFAGHATTPLSIRIRSNLAVTTTSAFGARAPRLFYRSLPLSGACTRLSEMYQV